MMLLAAFITLLGSIVCWHSSTRTWRTEPRWAWFELIVSMALALLAGTFIFMALR